MRYIILIVCIIAIGFSSCSGRTTKSESLKEAISKFKDTITPIEIVEYFPKTYSEVQTDTILSNGFCIKVKTYSDMRHTVSHTTKSDAFTIKMDIYRKWISDIEVKKDGIVVFAETINDAFLSKHMQISTADIASAVSLGTLYNQDEFQDDDNVVLLTGLSFPRENKKRWFSITIDGKGNFEIEDLHTI